MALVLIDVDGTLLQGANAERLFFRWLLARRRLGPRQLTAFMVFPLRYARRFGRTVFKKNKAYLSGLPVTAIVSLGADFVDSILLPRISTSLRQRLVQHLQAGDRLALLTGTPEFIARPLAARLSIPDVMATVCHQQAGRFTAKPPDFHPFGPDKVTAAERLCRPLKTPLSACIAYADSIHDLALLEKVRHAVAVTPDAALRHRANHRGWEILTA